MNGLIKIFWIFMFGCFLGSLLETVWCLIKDKKLKRRKDLIYGYFTSMYGIAGSIIVLVVELFYIENIFLIFLISIIVSGLVEYFTSFIQEKSMGILFWDYSEMRLNLHGRVNFCYLMAFGCFGVLWCRWYSILIEILNKLISGSFLIVSSIILCIFMVYNFLISWIVGIRQKYRRRGRVAKNRLEIWIDDKYSDEYMSKVFPDVIFIDERQS